LIIEHIFIIEDYSLEGFEKIDWWVGTIIKEKDFLNLLNMAWRAKIDFGNGIEIKKTSDQISTLYEKEDLLGKQVIALVDLPKNK
jgi:tRNA-binding protein